MAPADAPTRLTLARVSAYSRVLQLAKARTNALLLDVGCCCESAHSHCPVLNSYVSPKHADQSETTPGR